MDSNIIVALISLIGSLAGTFSGIFVSSKLTLYRIEQLERKMDRFNVIEEKINNLEKHNAVQDEKIKNSSSEIDELKRGET